MVLARIYGGQDLNLKRLLMPNAGEITRLRLAELIFRFSWRIASQNMMQEDVPNRLAHCRSGGLRYSSTSVEACELASFSCPCRPGANDVCCVGAQQLTSQTCRSEEHTSELQSLLRISYAVICMQ